MLASYYYISPCPCDVITQNKHIKHSSPYKFFIYVHDVYEAQDFPCMRLEAWPDQRRPWPPKLGAHAAHRIGSGPTPRLVPRLLSCPAANHHNLHSIHYAMHGVVHEWSSPLIMDRNWIKRKNKHTEKVIRPFLHVLVYRNATLNTVLSKIWHTCNQTLL